MSEINDTINVNQKDIYGDTPLHVAIETRNINLFKIVFTYPGLDINLQNDSGETVLHYACNFRSSCNSFKECIDQFTIEEIIEIILTHPIIDVNLQNKCGQTALHIACRKIKENITKRILEALLQHPTINVNLQDNHGKTALHLACKCCNKKALRMLLERTS